MDERRRTTDENIYAIGDVAGEPMLAHKAAHEGKVAVEAILGEPAVWEPRAIPAVVFTDREVVDYRSAFRADRQRARAFLLGLFRRGIFLNPMSTKLYLSLAHTMADLERFLAIARATLREDCSCGDRNDAECGRAARGGHGWQRRDHGRVLCR